MPLDLSTADHANFHHAFLKALLESERMGAEEQDPQGLAGARWETDNLHPTVADALRGQCARFVRENAADLAQAQAYYHYSLTQAGSDFMLSRNGHGAGFFDRDLEDLGERLQAAAQAMGAIELYLGDDGVLYAAGLETPRRPVPRG